MRHLLVFALMVASTSALAGVTKAEIREINAHLQDHSLVEVGIPPLCFCNSDFSEKSLKNKSLYNRSPAVIEKFGKKLNQTN